MPRPKREGAPEPKKRSRFGCWPCKRRRIKCGEEKPACANCAKVGDVCDYSVKLNWDGRNQKDDADASTTFRVSTISTNTRSRDTRSPSTSRISPPNAAPTTTQQQPNRIIKSGSARPKQAKFVYLFDGRNRTDASTNGTHDVTTSAARRQSSRSISSAPLEDLFGSAGQSQIRVANAPNGVQNGLQNGIRSSIDGGPGEGSTTYGYDLGSSDLDYPANDDANALSRATPPPFQTEDGSNGDLDISRADSAQDPRFNAHAYYATPVPVSFPKTFEPLPDFLAQNPMNLLYFHHFMNHTARILVPCDCPANMMRSEVPRLALKDEMLLKLVVACAAHHRARLLGQPHPRTRIAMLIESVFPQLRQALTGSAEGMTDQAICAALFIVSLEVIDPNAFDTPMLGWEEHLGLARQCIIMRGEFDRCADARILD